MGLLELNLQAILEVCNQLLLVPVNMVSQMWLVSHKIKDNSHLILTQIMVRIQNKQQWVLSNKSKKICLHTLIRQDINKIMLKDHKVDWRILQHLVLEWVPIKANMVNHLQRCLYQAIINSRRLINIKIMLMKQVIRMMDNQTDKLWAMVSSRLKWTVLVYHQALLNLFTLE